MAAHFPIRPVAEHEFDAFRVPNEHAFLGSPLTPQHRAEALSRLELDRTLAAFDGPTPVASAAIWSFRMAIPGENHHSDRCTAATPMATVAIVSTKAIRRLRVMNWRRI